MIDPHVVLAVLIEDANPNLTCHGLSLHEASAKEAEGEKNEKKEVRNDVILISLVKA